MHLVNSFEERFCKSRDYRRDFINELSGELASNLSQNVVSLASFKGDYTVTWSFGFHFSNH